MSGTTEQEDYYVPFREDVDDEPESSLKPGFNENNYFAHEISQATKVKSAPHRLLIRAIPDTSRLPVATVRMIFGREGNQSGRGRFSSADRCHILSRYLPVNGPWSVDRMKSRAYVSQFSTDGSLFVAGFQGRHIRIYNVDRGWKVQKNIIAKSLRWTITDTSLSPDQRYLVYASMSPVVHIVNIESASTESLANVTELHDGLDFSGNDNDEDEFSIFSVKFSTDGRELVAASSDESIYVYDLMANKLNLRIPAHKYDVNTVCFADETGHIIYSGSDDALCKGKHCSMKSEDEADHADGSFFQKEFIRAPLVWDKRCFITKGQAVGVLMGHTEGITFIESRGDGRHFISNGKDQTTKLWDIRKMSSNAKSKRWYRNNDWDYRWMEYPTHELFLRHPNDLSLATYRGHSVLRTLIRCHFSPEYSTGQKYIYTGSSDGSVYIYDVVSGSEVGKLDHHEEPVRDCSWHPFYPIMISSSWDGLIARWEFPGNGEAPVKRRRTSRRSRIVEHL